MIPLIIRVILEFVIYIIGIIYSLVILKVNINSLMSLKLITKNISLIITIICIVVTLFIVNSIVKRKKISLSECCLFYKAKGIHILICVFAGISFNIVTNQIISTLYTKNLKVINKYYFTSVDFYNDMNIGLFFFTFCILTPIFEEILFRGVIQDQWKDSKSISVIILIQPILFAVYHLNIIQGLYTFILSIFLTIVSRTWQSIWPAIILHICFNSTNILIKYLILIEFINSHWNIILWTASIFLMIFIIYMSIQVYSKKKSNEKL